MIDIVYHPQFIKRAQKLSKVQRLKLASLVELLRENPYDSRLHTKHLSSPLLGFLSFRITRDWRVIFCFVDEDTVRLVDVAHRSEIYR